MKKLIKRFAQSLYFLFQLSIVMVALYSVVPVILTPHNVMRLFEGHGLSLSFASYDNSSKAIYRAVIAAEDGRFLSHSGIDWRAVKDAQNYNRRKKGKKKRGASTISMQTAKNVFMPHTRIYIRKALEIYFTILIESVWGKKRILEVYGNIVELGPGIYGFDAAARHFFNKDASKLKNSEAALIAAVLPNPIRWSIGKPTPYIRKRQANIMARMNGVALPK